MPAALHIDAMRRLVAHALEAGGTRVSLMRTVWDISGNCQNSYVRELHARPPGREKWFDALARSKADPVGTVDLDGTDLLGTPQVRRHDTKHVIVGNHLGPTEIPLLLELHTRCRKCDHCRQARANLWIHRAKSETLAAPRTWFGTLTIRPEQHMMFLAQARKRLRVQGVEYDGLSYGEQFILHHAEANREITLAIKRLRMQARSPFRYLVVCEQHKSGLPHYHVLLHEIDADQPVRHATLAKMWPHGFTAWKLCDAKQAGYVCKYLAKSSVARVRASLRYGDTTPYGHSLFQRREDKPLMRGEGDPSNRLTYISQTM